MLRGWLPSLVVIGLFAVFCIAGAWLERRRRRAEGLRRQALPAAAPARAPASRPPAAAPAGAEAKAPPAAAARTLAETEHP